MPPTNEMKSSEAAEIIAVAREAEKNLTPRTFDIEGLPLMFEPRTGQIHSLEKYQARPRRQRATVELNEAASFIEYVNLHKLTGTRIFGQASETGGSFTAVIDYHWPTPPEGQALIAGHGEHNCCLTLATTPEWRRWIEKNGQLITQEAFAEFIEDNLTDIIAPDGADILEMAQLLQGKKAVAFKSGRNLRDGSIQLEYTEDIQLTGGGTNRRDDTMKLPEKFKLGLVPFLGANGIEIEARLRFRIGNGGALHFAYILDRPYKVVEQAYLLTRAEIEDKTGINVMTGKATIHKA